MLENLLNFFFKLQVQNDISIQVVDSPNLLSNLSDCISSDSYVELVDSSQNLKQCEIQESNKNIVIKEPPVKKKKYDSVLKDLDLQQLILENPLGVSINTIHQCDQKLDTSCQSRIVGLISNYLLKQYGTLVLIINK